MVGLILFGLAIALGFGVIVSGVSAGLAWFAGLLFPKAYEPTIALVTAGFIPVGLLVWSIIGFAGSGCCESGPEAQGLLILMVMNAVLLLVVWPLGYRLNLSLVEGSRI